MRKNILDFEIRQNTDGIFFNICYVCEYTVTRVLSNTFCLTHVVINVGPHLLS